MSTHPLLAQLREQARDATTFAQRTAWMRAEATATLVTEVLAAHGVETTAPAPRVLLAVLFMAMDADAVFSDEAHDVIMRREAQRFHDAMLRALESGVLPPPPRRVSPRRSLAAAVERVLRFHAGWRRVDVAHTVEHLTASVVAHGVREREAGVARPEPPEGVLEHLRRLDPAAADEAVRRFHVTWTRVAPQNVGTVVADVAERALWDVVTAQVRDEGNFEGLFGLLEELRGAIRALIAHSERGVADLDDTFDVAFLKQQADHGVLTLADVGNLMRYLVDTVGRMHAPADDADVEAWRRATEAAIEAGRNEDLATFVHVRLLPFLRATLHRVRAVYARVVAFGEELAARAQATDT